MSGESGSESSGDEREEGFKLINKYTIILLDSTKYMKDDLKQCLKDLYKIYSALKTSAHIREFSTGVISIGCKFLEDESENIVLIQPKTFDIRRLKSVVDNFNVDKCINEKLPFKDGIEMATDMIITTCKAKEHDTKNIVLITNNPAPVLDDQDDVSSVARMLSRNKIDFSLLPFRFFTSSKFYNSFFRQLPDGSCTLIQSESTFLDSLCDFLEPLPRLQKTQFYYNEDNYFVMKAMKMFQIKYRSLSKAVLKDDGSYQRAKLTQGLDQDGYFSTKLIKLDDSSATPSTSEIHQQAGFVPKTEFNKVCRFGSNETAVFTKDEIDKIDKKCGEPSHRGLYLMYVGSVPDEHIPSDDVRSRLLVPGYSSTDKTMFHSFWLYCVQNDKAIYCMYLTKKRPYLVLKPILFKDQPMFLQYCLGYANNYRCTITPHINNKNRVPNEQLKKVMADILLKLKNTETGFLDIPDNKILYEQALFKAKITKTEFRFDSDGISMEDHHVNEKIGELAQQFKNLL